ncbi:hypothetical protein, partial [Collimonas silvisoli]|uniref:hypothetical protein n=1 Tax=Collimonas silvisoli TaxID=2825884 RepID=UPI001B8CA7A4
QKHAPDPDGNSAPFTENNEIHCPAEILRRYFESKHSNCASTALFKESKWYICDQIVYPIFCSCCETTGFLRHFCAYGKMAFVLH